MKIPRSLLAPNINAYSDEGALAKAKFHTDGKKFMKELAVNLGISGQCDIHSNVAGIAVSGEITLHGDHIYVQLGEGFMGSTSLLYRSCKHRKDYTGGQNNTIRMSQLAEDERTVEAFLRKCRSLMVEAEQEVSGKATSAVA